MKRPAILASLNAATAGVLLTYASMGILFWWNVLGAAWMITLCVVCLRRVRQ